MCLTPKRYSLSPFWGSWAYPHQHRAQAAPRRTALPPTADISNGTSAFAPISSALHLGADLHVAPAGLPLLMRWTAPTRRHLGAKMVVFMNHMETGAVL